MQSTSEVPFAGADYVDTRDRPRLTRQIDRILAVMQDGVWRTVKQLSDELHSRFRGENFPENSIQAQLRNLRKIGYSVPKRNVAGHGTGKWYEYSVIRIN